MANPTEETISAVIAQLKNVAATLESKENTCHNLVTEVTAKLEALKSGKKTLHAVNSTLVECVGKLRDALDKTNSNLSDQRSSIFKAIGALGRAITLQEDGQKQLRAKVDTLEERMEKFEERELEQLRKKTLGDASYDLARLIQNYVWPGSADVRQPLTFGKVQEKAAAETCEVAKGKWDGSVELLEYATEMNLEDIIDTERYLRSQRFWVGHLSDLQRIEAKLGPLKRAVDNNLVQPSQQRRTKKLLDLLASFSTDKKLFTPNLTVAQRLRQMTQEKEAQLAKQARIEEKKAIAVTQKLSVAVEKRTTNRFEPLADEGGMEHTATGAPAFQQSASNVRGSRRSSRARVRSKNRKEGGAAQEAVGAGSVAGVQHVRGPPSRSSTEEPARKHPKGNPDASHNDNADFIATMKPGELHPGDVGPGPDLEDNSVHSSATIALKTDTSEEGMQSGEGEIEAASNSSGEEGTGTEEESATEQSGTEESSGTDAPVMMTKEDKRKMKNKRKKQNCRERERMSSIMKLYTRVWKWLEG